MIVTRDPETGGINIEPHELYDDERQFLDELFCTLKENRPNGSNIIMLNVSSPYEQMWQASPDGGWIQEIKKDATI